MDGSAANATIAWRLAIPADAASSAGEAPVTGAEAGGAGALTEALASEQVSGAGPPTGALTSEQVRAADTSLQATSAIAAGDTEAFAQFYELWFDRMVHMARSITGRDESFCLDVTQDAMLRIVRSMRPMPTEDDLRRWLLRIVHTAALDRLRSEARRQRRERIAGEGARNAFAAEAGAPDPELVEQITALRAQLEALGADDRGLLLLRFGRSATLRLAAAATGSTQGAAHGRIRRLAARLRERMEAHDDA